MLLITTKWFAGLATRQTWVIIDTMLVTFVLGWLAGRADATISALSAACTFMVLCTVFAIYSVDRRDESSIIAAEPEHES